ncbi:MAG: alanine racemase [Candidatus Hydrogenedentes bacterium]|jgi:alanine racemase|nr:alanine racemase [Candidatus Hydrogenedentota bacterium]
MSRNANSRVIIDLDAYRANLAFIRKVVGNTVRMIPIVKANAYGHGLRAIAEAAVDEGVALIGVATVDEGLYLRESGMTAPILVMLQPPRRALEDAIKNKLTLMVADKGLADDIGAIAYAMNQVVPIHFKIDTGMGRQGIWHDEANAMLQHIKHITNIDIQGICTHFPSADIEEDSFTLNQIKVFKQLLKQLQKLGFPYEIAHAANSAAIVNYRDSYFDAVRPGLISYGVWPSKTGIKEELLKRVLRWETNIIQLRELPPQSNIGYDRSYTTYGPTRTAILPVGYADGYPYRLANKSDVLIRGKRCPVRGAVSMDQIVVDVSALPRVSQGDTAILIGKDRDMEITAEELAQKAGTIPYDILTGIGPRVCREYIQQSKDKQD